VFQFAGRGGRKKRGKRGREGKKRGTAIRFGTAAIVGIILPLWFFFTMAKGRKRETEGGEEEGEKGKER